jgi:hypothetical protein
VDLEEVLEAAVAAALAAEVSEVLVVEAAAAVEPAVVGNNKPQSTYLKAILLYNWRA